MIGADAYRAACRLKGAQVFAVSMKEIQYRVKWTGGDEDREWYDASGFDNSPEIIEDFYARYPNKLRP